MTPAAQLDRRLAGLTPLVVAAARPSRGWIRAIRNALGMTASQLARRMGVSQPRISELEGAEATGNITMQSLERAAEAMGCRLVYALIPLRPLTETLEARAETLAERHLSAVGQTMRLEDQAVRDEPHGPAWRAAVAELMRTPARLWDDIE
jgi:predicted DNA-binding mobile mystery protein A